MSGIRPLTALTMTETPAENARTVMSSRVLSISVTRPASTLAMTSWAQRDSNSPSHAPAAPSIRLSVSNWRASRHLVAPSARRVSTSRRRLTPRESSRFATLADPMSRMQPTAPKRPKRVSA